jgi:hypothetical protein
MKAMNIPQKTGKNVKMDVDGNHQNSWLNKNVLSSGK